MPASARGKQGTGLGTLSDVWGTLCALALVDPTDYTAAAVVGGPLPPVDGVDLSAMISGLNLSHSPRDTVPMMPLHANDLEALDAWDALRAALLADAAAAGTAVTFQVSRGRRSFRRPSLYCAGETLMNYDEGR